MKRITVQYARDLLCRFLKKSVSITSTATYFRGSGKFGETTQKTTIGKLCTIYTFFSGRCWKLYKHNTCFFIIKKTANEDNKIIEQSRPYLSQETNKNM